jgi:photosystem II stability/assembly factor-like uncharacterized protein
VTTGDLASRRDRRRHLPFALILVGVFGVAAIAAYVVRTHEGHPRVQAGPGSSLPLGKSGLPRPGVSVPAYDLFSDPVFPTLQVGYAIERHATSGGSSEALARSQDGGRSWHLVGPFPFASGYSQVQFVSIRSGYAFGPAGVAVTHDGGAHWAEGEALGGRLQRVVPIGDDVWATYAVCNGPPVSKTLCSVHVAISKDGGIHWSQAAAVPPLAESFGGGDVLARMSFDEAYIVSYGSGGGGLARTTDDGATWTSLADPCSPWATVDIAAPVPDFLWMICGGPPQAGGAASAKAVFQSSDAGRTWVAKAYTGFGPASGPLAGRAPFGHLWFAGRLSQLATIDPTRAWIGVSGIGVLVTMDGGRDWSLVDGMSTGASRAGVAGVGVTFDDALHGWAIEFRRGVWRTSDAVHWQLIDGT